MGQEVEGSMRLFKKKSNSLHFRAPLRFSSLLQLRPSPEPVSPSTSKPAHFSSLSANKGIVRRTIVASGSGVQ